MTTGIRNLLVYQKGFSLAMDIFELIKTFPKEEKFGLVSQIRNSSRSVCSNLGEGYRKRRYPAHFVSKI
jgi:four helix bundle protein